MEDDPELPDSSVKHLLKRVSAYLDLPVFPHFVAL
jgi:hypothetical protein